MIKNFVGNFFNSVKVLENKIGNLSENFLKNKEIRRKIGQKRKFGGKKENQKVDPEGLTTNRQESQEQIKRI